MMKSLVAVCMLLIIGCSSKKEVKQTTTEDVPFEVVGVSTDPTYGYTQENHIKVGGVSSLNGPENERKYLNKLAGPNGEPLSYYRDGSCCAVPSENGIMGMAMLDVYHVTWLGAEDTVSLFINMYDRGTMQAPKGFTIRYY